MVRIEDGKGNSGDASVSSDQRLDVSSRSAPRDFYVSRDDGQVFTSIADDPGAVANEEIMYLQNTSPTKDIVIDDVIIASDTASKWRLKFVTGTASGTTITPVNLNKNSSNSAGCNCLGGAAGVTGLTDDGDIAILRVPAGATDMLVLEEALRLGQDDAVAVECETSSAVEITIEFHFE